MFPIPLILLTLTTVTYVSCVPPVIFVPGLGGSVLEARLESRSSYRDCKTNSDWYTVWFSETQVLTRYACFLQNIKLHLASNGSIVSDDGVYLRPKDFGGLDGVRYANKGTRDPVPVPYLETFVQAFLKKGYEAGVSLRAATYDFRKAGEADFLEDLFKKFQLLIEETAKLNDNQAVHLIGHSLGSPVVNYFLQTMNEQWVERFIGSATLIAAPLGGTPVAVQGSMMGPVFPYVPQQLPALVAPAVRTFPSILWMFPSQGTSEQHKIWGNTTFLETNDKNYTYKDIPQLLKDLNSTLLSSMLLKMESVRESGFKQPGKVPVMCMYANDSDTALTLKTDVVTDIGGKIVQHSKGDGTVNIQSLRICNTWSDQSKVTVKEYALGGSLSAHTDIVKKPQVIQDIMDYVNQNKK